MNLIEKLKLKIADRLSLWALRLRGQTIYPTACWVDGNRASFLCDKIWMNAVLVDFHNHGGEPSKVKDSAEEMIEIDESLKELAQISGATWVAGIRDIHQNLRC